MHRTQPSSSSSPTASDRAVAPSGAPSAACSTTGGWPLERVLFAVAGTVTAASAALAALVSPWFLILTAFVAINQLAYATVGVCGASLVLRRFAGLHSVLYSDAKEAR